MAKKRPKKRKAGPADSSKAGPATDTTQNSSTAAKAEATAGQIGSDQKAERREDTPEDGGRSSKPIPQGTSEAQETGAAASSEVAAAQQPSDRFDAGGLIVVGVIFGLIGLAIAVEFWLN